MTTTTQTATRLARLANRTRRAYLEYRAEPDTSRALCRWQWVRTLLVALCRLTGMSYSATKAAVCRNWDSTGQGEIRAAAERMARP